MNNIRSQDEYKTLAKQRNEESTQKNVVMDNELTIAIDRLYLSMLTG